MASTSGYSCRRDGQLPCNRRSRRLAEGRAGGRACVRLEPSRHRDPVPPGDPERRHSRRIPLGRGAKASSTRPRGVVLSAVGPTTDTPRTETGLAAWVAIAAEQGAHGYALIPSLPAPWEYCPVRDRDMRSRATWTGTVRARRATVSSATPRPHLVDLTRYAPTLPRPL